MTQNSAKNLIASYHRNGISGTGFDVALFNWKDGDGNERRMMAVLFPEPGSCAVFDLAELGKENIMFAQGNSWRGDHFEADLRAQVSQLGTGAMRPFAIPGNDETLNR